MWRRRFMMSFCLRILTLILLLLSAPHSQPARGRIFCARPWPSPIHQQARRKRRHVVHRHTQCNGARRVVILPIGLDKIVSRKANGGTHRLALYSPYSLPYGAHSQTSPQIRGLGLKKDVARAVFFSQAHAASQAADAMLGKHRPKMIEGPLPGGLDPGIMWKSTGYTL